MAVELLNVWTGDVYDEDSADPEDSGYVPLGFVHFLRQRRSAGLSSSRGS